MRNLTVMATTNIVDRPARYGSIVIADENLNDDYTVKSIPTRIEVMRAGNWPPENNKGRALSITTSDLNEFANNFKAGVGVPGGKAFGQIPIDFSHNDEKEAAGWITDLTVEGDILYASVTWTAAGKQALEGGMYKCFSPSFWPACLGVYPDPENHNITAKNVLVGGGLTNIPFFKDLTAIMASNTGNRVDVNNNEGVAEMPTFDEVRIKDVASLTADDKKVLADNASNMSDVEKTKFTEVAEVKAAVDKAAADKKAEDDKIAADAAKVTSLNTDDAKLLADLKSGKYKMIEASQYDGLTATVNQLEADNKAAKEREIKASVADHVKRGAIKADQAEGWEKRILADSTMNDLLAAIPSNKLVADEIGNGHEENDATSAFEAKVKAKMDADKNMDYATAVTAVANEDAGLANSHEAQIKQ